MVRRIGGQVLHESAMRWTPAWRNRSKMNGRNSDGMPTPLSITLIGTGGTSEPFHLMAKPLEFRNQVQQQIEKRGGVPI
jgi:hypothetical protein